MKIILKLISLDFTSLIQMLLSWPYGYLRHGQMLGKTRHTRWIKKNFNFILYWTLWTNRTTIFLFSTNLQSFFVVSVQSHLRKYFVCAELTVVVPWPLSVLLLHSRGSTLYLVGNKHSLVGNKHNFELFWSRKADLPVVHPEHVRCCCCATAGQGGFPLPPR